MAGTVNGGLRAITHVLSGVAIIVLSSAIIAMWIHVSDNDKHPRPEAESIKQNRIRVTVREMVEVPPREITQRLDRLESGMAEMKGMVRDLLVALVQKQAAMNHQKENKGD